MYELVKLLWKSLAVYQFPTAAVTNYHKLWLNQMFIILHFWRSQSYVPSGEGRESISLSSPASRRIPQSMLIAFFSLQSQGLEVLPGLSNTTTSLILLLPPSSSLKDSFDCIKPTWSIQNKIPILRPADL